MSNIKIKEKQNEQSVRILQQKPNKPSPTVPKNDTNQLKEGLLVIGWIGEVEQNRSAFINLCLKCNAFKEGERIGIASKDDITNWNIDRFYDEEENVLHLNLSSTLAHHRFQNILERERSDSFSFQQWLVNEGKDHLHALLYIFYVCNSILVLQSGTQIHLQWLRLLKILQNIHSTETFPSIEEFFADRVDEFPFFKEGIRVSSPNILFVFNQQLPLHLLKNDFRLSSQSINEKIGNLAQQIGITKTLPQLSAKRPREVIEKALELQLKGLLSKMNLMNLTENSLFQIGDENSPLSLVVSMIQNHQSSPILQYLETSFLGSGNSSTIEIVGADPGIDEIFSGLQALRQFILTQTTNAPRLVGSLTEWESFQQAISELLFGNSEKSITHVLEKSLEIESSDIIRLSYQLCSSSYETAKNLYLSTVPPIYTSKIHQQTLSESVEVFLEHARGHAVKQFQEQLIHECDSIWENGRKQCEQLSLSGKHCNLKIHDNNSEHSSNMKSLRACSCGSTREYRPEFFNIQQFLEYSRDLCHRCCKQHQLNKLPLTTRGESQENHSANECFVYSIGNSIGITEIHQEGFIAGHRQLSAFSFMTSRSDVTTAPASTTPSTTVNPQPAAHLQPSHHHREQQQVTINVGKEINLNQIIKFARKQKTKRERNTKRNTPNEDSSNSQVEVNVFCGFEYECQSQEGHRFLYSPEEPERSHHSSNPKGTTALTPLMRLYHTCIVCKQMAQLQRIFVATPQHTTVHFSPIIQFRRKLQDGEVRHAFSSSFVPLPSNKFLCVKLPAFYLLSSDNTILQNSVEDPYVATLAAGALWVDTREPINS